MLLEFSSTILLCLCMNKIINNTDVQEYSNFNKIYIPDEMLDSNFSYYYDDNYITIITDNNCYTQYNSTFCDCNRFILSNNVVTDSYSCNINQNLPKLNYNSLSDNINDSLTLNHLYLSNTIVYLLMFILALFFASFLIKDRRYL